jgi:AcrR family transcriptional regulator
MSQPASHRSPRRRARTADAKSRRRAQILDAAIGFLDKGDPNQITVASVAARAGVAKGTVYLYFRTKEELFLGLTERLLEEWFDELDAALAGGQGWIQASALANLLTEALDRRPLLRHLLGVLGPVLEQNLDADRAVRFKWRVAGRMTATGTLLERRTVFLRPGDGTRVLLHLQALAAGLQVLAEPPTPVRQVLDAPGLELFRLEFAREFRSAARALLTGLERTN